MAGYRARRKSAPEPERIAFGLGWLSVGLGVAQVLAPRAVARLAGVSVPPALMILCGLRELTCGVGLLTQEQRAPWITARIAGDALDLAALGVQLLVPGADRRRIAIAAAAAGGVTVLDVYCGRELAARAKRPAPRHEITTIHVTRPPETVYRFWRDFANLPLVMPHLKTVQVIDETCSHWSGAAPAGARIEWDAEIIDDVLNERIAWRALEGSPVFDAGSVQLEPSGGGTLVRVELLFDRPAATLASALATLFGRGPHHRARADLDAFRRLVETHKDQDNPRLMA